MLGIGMQEILVILVVALIFIGPKRLPDVAKTLGKGFSEFKRATDEFQNTIRRDLQVDRSEELRRKYPNLVPEEDGAPPPAEASAATAPDAASEAPQGSPAGTPPDAAPPSAAAETSSPEAPKDPVNV